ncbi:MAG: hypothetical protein QG670_2769 [Thermoproteota archaeon]|nr:hypothetical protein [Thermoproteota archaeon]
MRLQSIALIAVAVIAIIAVTTIAISLLKSPPAVSIELNSSSFIEVKRGTEFFLDVSVRK